MYRRIHFNRWPRTFRSNSLRWNLLAGAVFTMTNAAAGNSVVAFSRDSDGTLELAGAFSTGGQGIGVMQFWVVQLSSGRTLWTGGVGGYIAASHDGIS